MFGMGCVRVRETTQTGCTTELFDDDLKIMGMYASPSDSLRDLLIWLRVNRVPKSMDTVEEYAEALRRRGYFTLALDAYIEGLKKWM